MKVVNLLVVSVALVLLAGCVINTTSKPTAHRTADTFGNPNPTAARLNAQLGIAYVNNGNISRAKSKLNQALKQGPNMPEVMVAMAYYYEKTGDSKDAQHYYQAALNLDPTRGNTQNNYGTFLCREGQHQSAIKHFLLATKDPEYINTAAAYENIGLCAMQIPDNKLAEKYFKKALDTNPNSRWSLLGMTEFKYAAGEYRVANKYLERYLKSYPPDPQSLWLGIRVAGKLGKKNQAASYALMLTSRFKDSKEYKEYKTAILTTKRV